MVMSRVNRLRSIPACAGEPPDGTLVNELEWVYPRVCGGTDVELLQGDSHSGLSPRVRGNPVDANVLNIAERSIPACAGEPGYVCANSPKCKVYPRVCGGTGFERQCILSDFGLSPRVRGNPVIRTLDVIDPRSIPACAGEPPQCLYILSDIAVYPRVCGGTLRPRSSLTASIGLSPRVRGNLFHSLGE